MAPLSTFPSRSTSHPNPKPSYSPTSLSSSLPPPSLWISVAAPPPPHQPGRQDLVDSGVSPVGLRQMARAALELQRLGTCEDDCWIWPSITQRAYQAVEIIAAANGINCSRIVPEYSFLDARGLGSFEGKNLDTFPEILCSELEAHVSLLGELLHRSHCIPHPQGIR